MESVRAAVSGRGSVIASDKRRRHHGLLRGRRRTRHEARARAQGAKTGERRRTGPPNGARDHEEMPVTPLVGIHRSKGQGCPDIGGFDEARRKTFCEPRAGHAQIGHLHPARVSHPGRQHEAELGKPEGHRHARPDYRSGWGLAVGGESGGQVERTHWPAGSVDGLDHASDRARGRPTHAGSQERVDDDVGLCERRAEGSGIGNLGHGLASPLERVQVDPRIPLHLAHPSHEPRGDSRPAAEQVARYHEAVAAVATLPAHDSDPAALDRT